MYFGFVLSVPYEIKGYSCMFHRKSLFVLHSGNAWNREFLSFLIASLVGSDLGFISYIHFNLWLYFFHAEIVRKHEELLCAYRDLRAQVELLGRDELDLGPDEHEMIITDAELQSAQQKEIVRLQSELHNIKINNKRVSNRH